jgi:hypothetical protein
MKAIYPSFGNFYQATFAHKPAGWELKEFQDNANCP